MIAKLRAVSRPKFDLMSTEERQAARERVELLTVREGACSERWGSFGHSDDFKHYKDR